MEFISRLVQTENVPYIIVTACAAFMFLLYWVKLNVFMPGFYSIPEAVIGYTLHGAAQVVSAIAIWYIYRHSGNPGEVIFCLFCNAVCLYFFVRVCSGY